LAWRDCAWLRRVIVYVLGGAISTGPGVVVRELNFSERLIYGTVAWSDCLATTRDRIRP